MADNDDDFSKAFEGFGEDPAEVEVPKEENKEEQKDEEPKEEEQKPAPDDKPKLNADDEADGDTSGDEPVEPKQDNTPTEQPKEGEPATPAPLTKEDVQSVVSDLLTTERSSGKELDDMTQEVLEKFYPDGLSNVIVDSNTGKEIRTPQDVIEASGGSMSAEEAHQWLMNEQYKLDKAIEKNKDDARTVAETTLNFRRGAQEVLKDNEDLFKWRPELQTRVWEQYKKLVKADEEKGIIYSAPDIKEFYDFTLEPYRLAYAQSQQAPVEQKPPEPPKPTQDDRLDEGGDGGPSPVNDPNDFAQQVEKAFKRGS